MIRFNLLKSLQPRTPIRSTGQRTRELPKPEKSPRNRRTDSGEKTRPRILMPLLIVAAVVVASAGLYFAVRLVKSKLGNKTGMAVAVDAAPSTSDFPQVTDSTRDTSAVDTNSLDYPKVDDSTTDNTADGEGSPVVTPPTNTNTAPPPAPQAQVAPATPPTPPPAAETPAATGYSSSSNSSGSIQNIAFQYITSRRMLQTLENASTAGLGFTTITFTPPGTFSVHGVASTEADLQHFQNTLSSLPGVTLEPGQIQSSGAARIFSFSGQVQYPDSANTPRNHPLTLDQRDAALQRFVSVATGQNISLPPPQLQTSSAVGGLQHLQQFVYHVEAPCDYDQLLALLGKLQASRSNVGIQRLKLEARGQENMVVSLDLVLYAK